MCEFYFLIFLSIMVLGLLSSLVYLNFEIVLIIVILIVLYSSFYTDSNNNNKQDIIENAKEILVGFYKINDKSHIKTVELYFKNNGTCDILYENIYSDYWYNTEYQKKYQKQEINDILRRNIPYIIKGNKVYLEFDEYDKRTFIIYKNYLVEIRGKENIIYNKIEYSESKIYTINRNKRMTGVKRINFKTETKKKITKPKTEKENNNDLKNVIDKDNNSNNNSTKEKVKTASKKSKKATKEATKEEVTKQKTSSKKKKEVSTTKIKKEKTNTKKETTSTTKKTEKKKQPPTKKTKVNSNKNTKTKEQQQTINKTIKDLDVKNTREKNLSKTYVIEYFNENEFRKKERGIKKYNMLAYKKLMFEYYPSLREGNFSGVVVSKNDKEKITKYELKLPTDSYFSKVYEDIVLHYTVYENQKIVMLNNITPDDILTEGHQKELSTYKGVPISKSHTEKDMFKINLLNMLGK